MARELNPLDLEHRSLFYFPPADYVPYVCTHVNVEPIKSEATPVEEPNLTAPPSTLTSPHNWQHVLFTTVALAIMLLTAWWTMASLTKLLFYRLQSASHFDFIELLIRGS